MGQQPPVLYPGTPNRKAEKAFKEKMSRNETAQIHDRIGQHLIEGGRDRDRVLDEITRSRKTFIQLSDRGVDKSPK
jgi:hypothetical protein